MTDNSVSCSCMLFTRLGYLCRHVFSAYRFRGIDKIPDKYISLRWKKDALPKKVFNLEFRYGVDNSISFKLRSEALNLVQQCGDRLRCDPLKLAAFVEEIKVIKNRIFQDLPNDPNSKNKGAEFEEIIGQPEPDSVSVVAPQGIRNKGCGTSRRLIGPGEKAKVKSKKKKRKCNFCGKLSYHDSRNCPTKKNKVADGSEEDCEEELEENSEEDNDIDEEE